MLTKNSVVNQMTESAKKTQASALSIHCRTKEKQDTVTHIEIE